MDAGSVFQEITSHAIYDVLILAGGGAYAYLKAKRPQAAPIAAYGLMAMTCLALLYFAFTGRGIWSPQRPETTTENVETNIKAWAENFQFGVRKDSTTAAYFSYVMTLRSGNPVQVVRALERPGYVQFVTTINVSPEHLAFMAKLNDDQKARVIQEITLELARSKIGFAMGATVPGTLGAVAVEKSVPITASFDEEKFAASIDEMDSAILLVKTATALALERENGGKTIK